MTKSDTKVTSAAGILLENGILAIPDIKGKRKTTKAALGTILANMQYHGYVPSKEALDRLEGLGDKNITKWWKEIEPLLGKESGAALEMEKHVVYKNFPQEVLDMSAAEYQIRQTLIYLGIPSELVAQEPKARAAMTEKRKYKTLQMAKPGDEEKVLKQLLNLPTAWTHKQLSQVEGLLFQQESPRTFEVSSVPFKGNLINIITRVIAAGKPLPLALKSAMDVLRLTVGLSNGDITLKTASKFRNFTRPERRAILELLEKSTNLEEDLARDKERWKKLLKNLHPGDFKQFKRVVKAARALREGTLSSFGSRVEKPLQDKNAKALDELAKRPGEFARKLQHTLKQFGEVAADKFIEVIPKLTVLQRLKTKKYLETINTRQYRTIAPQGNWKKLQSSENKIRIAKTELVKVVSALSTSISETLQKTLPLPVALDPATAKITIQTNNSEVTTYNRGTVLRIPQGTKFIRTASYWEHAGVWFDNGWNFFSKDWKSIGTCCWNVQSQIGAAFSGDPISATAPKGSACQLIDLNLEALKDNKVRYAVWSILSYSHVPFDKSKVFGALQLGEDPQKGKLFEPSRAQIMFPVKGTGLGKYVALIDLVEQTVTYLDANLRADVSSAIKNSTSLEQLLPQYLEYLTTLPTIHDLFSLAPSVPFTPKTLTKSKKTKPPKCIKVVYSDELVHLENSEEAYVFSPSNQANSFTPLNINNILNSK